MTAAQAWLDWLEEAGRYWDTHSLEAERMSDSEQGRQTIDRRAEVALEELRLGVATEADETRLDRVLRGLRTLDDEQAAAKTERDAALAQVAELREALRWVHQTVHQAHHDGPIDGCRKNTCGAVVRALAETEPKP
jgi:hypothetical protein